MTKFIIYCILLLQTSLILGQNVRTLSIDANNARPMNLSEIAEKVTPIVLEKSPGILQNVLLTNEYLFIASLHSIEQYDLSGKYIRSINCGGFVSANVTSDTIKRELYVAVEDTIKCYDYSGNLKKEYSLKTNSTFCLWYKGVLWVISHSFQPDKSTDYFINKINPLTGEVTTLSFMKKDKGNGVFQRGSLCRLTYYSDDLFASFEFDNEIYKIQKDKILPFIQWNINPIARSVADRSPLAANGFIGDYLFIKYRRDDNFYIYLENMRTGRKYNTSNIVDDVFHTNGNCEINSLDKKGRFFYAKDKNEIKGNSIGNIPLKNGPVVFIVKTK